LKSLMLRETRGAWSQDKWLQVTLRKARHTLKGRAINAEGEAALFDDQAKLRGQKLASVCSPTMMGISTWLMR
jgi:hypothetical protein